ncbi:MAG: rod shape-determining protein MreC, partial [Hyphomonadaceae bacterium]|nr:rod shape-determining protein MreC [Clostridia bacterium]
TLGFIVTPMQQATTWVKSGVRNTFGYFSDNQKIRQQNEAYENELAALQNENFALKQMDVENKRLRQMLDFKRTNAQFELVGANVIAKDSSNWFQKFTIDKGTNDGLTKDCAVINHQVLVGSIYDIGLNYAMVSAIIDDSSAVSALVVRTKDVTMLKGDLTLQKQGLCKLTYIPRDADIIPGDVLETSGLGGRFPKGLLIGRIKEIGKENAEYYNFAQVEPAVDFKRIEEVFIIKNSPQVVKQ